MQALLEALRPGEQDWDLAQAIDPARLPAHIAIIMDGNGRWAGRRRLPRVAGHKAGIGPVRSTVETCARLGVKALTLYAFSIENWKRPAERSGDPLAAAALLPPAGTARSAKERYPAAGHRPAGRAARPGAARTRFRRGGHLRQPRHAGEPGHQLRRPRRDRGRRQRHPGDGARRRQHRDPEIRRRPDRHEPLHRRLSRSRPADPHLGRNAHQQLPAVADRLRGVLRYRDAVARFHAHGPAAGRARLPEARPPLRRAERRPAAPATARPARRPEACSKRCVRHETAPDRGRADPRLSSTWCCSPISGCSWLF